MDDKMPIVAAIIGGIIIYAAASRMGGNTALNRESKSGTPTTTTEQTNESPFYKNGTPSIDDDDYAPTEDYYDNSESREDTYYSKKEFLDKLKDATGVERIEIEDSDSYCITTVTGWDNEHKKQMFIRDEYKINGNVIHIDTGNNDKGYFDEFGDNSVWACADESCISATRDNVSRDGIFETLWEDPDIRNQFASEEDYEDLWHSYQADIDCNFNDTVVLYADGDWKTESYEYRVGDDDVRVLKIDEDGTFSDFGILGTGYYRPDEIPVYKK